jgi:hypothetical protein
VKISTHLDEKPFRVATSTDRGLPLRKWKHLGTVYAVSSTSAAHQSHNGAGRIVATHPGHDGRAVLEFDDGVFLSVGF